MSVQAGSARRRAAAAVFTLAIMATGAVTAVTAVPAGPAAAATGSGGPVTGIVHTVSAAAQGATRAFWTPARMAAATALPLPGAVRAGVTAGPPHGKPKPTMFPGVPTVGALFFTTGTQQHFCTASVVDSLTANLVLTAAHCVYGSSYATNIEFVPAYHRGLQPYGAWPVQTIVVAAGWQQSHDPDLDFAFLSVTPPAGTHLPIQLVTGGLWLGIDLGYAHPIEVIGYNDTNNAPIKCATASFEFAPGQMKFFCSDFQDGTSGGPWILGYDNSTGTGTVFGVIGGYQEGGNYPWASYSAYFGWPTLQLFVQAERRQA